MMVDCVPASEPEHQEASVPRGLRAAVEDGVQQVDLDIRYVGFEIPAVFVVGYGLDYDERYRNLPYVGTLKPRSIPNRSVTEPRAAPALRRCPPRARIRTWPCSTTTRSPGRSAHP